MYVHTYTAVAPTTEAPTTQATTEAPTTQATTEAPTTQATTEAPTTQATTEAPTTQAGNGNLLCFLIIIILILKYLRGSC